MKTYIKETSTFMGLIVELSDGSQYVRIKPNDWISLWPAFGGKVESNSALEELYKEYLQQKVANLIG